jgi:hypothetical protein
MVELWYFLNCTGWLSEKLYVSLRFFLRSAVEKHDNFMRAGKTGAVQIAPV